MKDGYELWKGRCPGGMERKTLGEKTIETFPGLMDNLYQALRHRKISPKAGSYR